jgi:RNA polymerase primary sigma factor
VPRKIRVVQKSRHSSVAGPSPSATLNSLDRHNHPPDYADEPKAMPTGAFASHSDFWMDERGFGPTAAVELCGQDDTDPLWTGTLDGETKDDKEPASGDDDLVRCYLAEMGAFVRLTPAEEIALAKRIEQGRGGRRRQPSSRKTSLPRRAHAATEAQGTPWTDRLDSDQARAYMIGANLRLVVSIAKQFSGRGLALLDLIQEGNLGLMKAVDRFDWRRGCRFGTYASWWIKQSIGRAVSDQGRIIRLPAHIAESISRVQRMRQVWLQLYEEEPAAPELSKVARVSEERIAQIDQLTATPVSLDWPLPDGERTVGDQLPDETYLPRIDVLVDRERDRILQRSLSQLSPRERRVLCMHFGIGHRRAYTLEEIGRKFRLTRERIRQIEVKALKKLRQPGRSSRLEEGSGMPRQHLHRDAQEAGRELPQVP